MTEAPAETAQTVSEQPDTINVAEAKPTQEVKEASPTTAGPTNDPASPASPAVVEAAQTKRLGDVGYALLFGLTNKGTLAARWVTKPSTSMIALARVDFDVDEIKLSDPPFDCGRNVKVSYAPYIGRRATEVYTQL